MSHNRHQTNTIIIGGGLAGLVAAAYLEKAGEEYILFEALDEFGGLARGQHYQGVWLDFGLKSIPAGDITTNPLIKLKQDLGLTFNVETVLEIPLAWTKSGMTEFVGFGETKNKKIIRELAYYTEAPRILVSNGWKTLIDELLSIIPEDKRKINSHVTKLELAEEKIHGAVINGDEKFTAQNFIFTLAPALLLGLLPTGSFSPKTIQKLTKTEGLTSVNLDLATSKRLCEDKNIFILNDEENYIVGQFISNGDPLRQSEGLQVSSWMTLLDNEEARDDEYVSRTLKNMKKIIRKAFPETVASANWERIIVAPASHGGIIDMDLNQQIPDFYVIGGQVSERSKYITAALNGAIDVAHRIAAHNLSLSEKLMFEDVGI